jgi:hypothetical protein
MREPRSGGSSLGHRGKGRVSTLHRCSLMGWSLKVGALGKWGDFLGRELAGEAVSCLLEGASPCWVS